MWTYGRSYVGSGLAALTFVLLLLGRVSPEAWADDNDYWFAFPDQQPSGSTTFSVEITAENGANGNVLWGGVASTPFSLLTGETTIIPFPPSPVIGSGYHIDDGFNVQTDNEISVTVFMSGDYSGDAMRPLPEGELGTEYVVVSSPAGASGSLPSQFLIVGTSDNTTVSITPSDDNSAGLMLGISTDIVLNQGDVYQVQALQAGGDLTGTLISATEPVAVISGHYLGLVSASESCCASFMAACLPPVSAWGTDYFVAPSYLRSHDVFRVVAWSTDTLVILPGYPNVTLGPGEFFEFTASQGVTVTANAPVMVAQYFTSYTADGVTDADPALMIPPPSDSWGSRHQIATSTLSGVSHFVTLVTATAATASVTFDGVPLAPGDWVAEGELSRAFRPMVSGSHVVQGSQPLSTQVYGFRNYWSYGYYCRGTFVEPPLVEPLENPVITGLADVPNDQGRQIRLTWASSSLDSLNSAEPIEQYVLYRRHDPDLKMAPQASGATAWPGMIQEKDATWDFVGTVPAFGEDSYAAVVPTLADSTITGGLYWSFFMVRAATSVPTRFFDSQPDSGYSVDNIAPGVPQAVTAVYAAEGVVLEWNAAPEMDFQYYRIYRDTDPGFVPSPTNLVQEVASSAWTDPSADPWDFHYKITVLDYSGNESEAGSPESVSGVQGGAVPARTALLGAVPNPFNPTTKLSFEMAATGYVRLKVYDAAGRLVSTLVEEHRDAGRHEVIWDGRDTAGRMSSAGVYLYRLEADGYNETKRMVLIK